MVPWPKTVVAAMVIHGWRAAHIDDSGVLVYIIAGSSPSQRTAMYTVPLPVRRT